MQNGALPKTKMKMTEKRPSDTGERTLVADGNNLLYRSYHGYMGGTNNRPPGQGAPVPVFAISGMLLTLVRRARQAAADSLVVALDPPGGCPYRRALVDTYKKGRPETPGDLVSQLELSYTLLREAGLHVERPEGWEADDVMATIANSGKSHTFLLTADRDAIQSVSEDVSIILPDSGKIMGPVEVLARYGVPADLYPHLAAIRGEPGDGIPGMRGIGKVGAFKLVNRFGRVESVIAASDEDIAQLVGRKGLAAVRSDGSKALVALEAAKLRTDLRLEDTRKLADIDESRIKDVMGSAGLSLAGDRFASLVRERRRRAGG